MIIIVLAVISFILSFAPKILSLIGGVFGLITIILSLVSYNKNKKEKNKMEASIVGIIISVISIIICIINLVLSYNNYDKLESKDLIENRIDAFDSYKINDEINIGDKFNLQINNVSLNGNKLSVHVKITGMKDDVKISPNNFFIYNIDTNEITFADKSDGQIINYYSEIDSDEIVEETLIYTVSNNSENYLVYRDDVNSVKIAL